MSTFPVHTLESAPAAARPILEQAKKGLGFVPNLFGTFATSPALLEAYAAVGAAFDKTSLTPTERQVVLLTTSFENNCSYCMAAHSTISGMQGVDAAVVQALRSGEVIPDAKLQALSHFTRRVVQEGGFVTEGELQAFLDAGYTQEQVFDVILGIGMKTLSNTTNHIAEPPLDDAFTAQRWEAAAPVG